MNFNNYFNKEFNFSEFKDLRREVKKNNIHTTKYYSKSKKGSTYKSKSELKRDLKNL